MDRAWPSRGPLFIVSMWRGGSTLLFALLNKHPQVGLMWEADLHLQSAAFYKPKCLRDWPNRWELWSHACSRHKIDPATLDPRMDFKTALKSVYRGYASREQAVIWGDKSPNYYDRMTQLARQFPGSTFIIVWRNPVDTARSMERAAASGNRYFRKRGMKTRSLLGYAVLGKQYQALQRAGAPVHAINFEDLTLNTGQVMQEVCEFLGIAFDRRVASLEGADCSAIAEGEHHAFVRGDSIVADAQRPEVLQHEWRSKIDRYVRLWQREGGWPPFPHPLGDAFPDGEPSLFEQVNDRAAYLCWRFFDRLTSIVYAYAPLGLLRGDG